ncbi:hypothetical protein [Streptomyces marincola]|uniref:hypothetical protein n=1 Tax=Streptomyces marincola TaxID=2878388 RepID=UPI001CF3D371|nr:hypothetical protein [Streptomyces marincola]UCM86591.1 hypothetical protein LC193_00750 [Streptomyces marincola]
MSVPDDQDDLAELRRILASPAGWEPPPELRRPTASTHHNLVVLLLSCPFLGHPAYALLGRYLTEQALYQDWFRGVAKGSGRSLTEMAELARLPGEVTGRVYAAWLAFDAAAGSEGPDAEVGAAVAAARSGLEKALAAAAGALAAARAA